MEIREVTYLAIAIRICAAVLFGGLLGWERGLKNRAAGLRTYMLVCVGACLVMLTNQFIYQVYGTGDPVRMGAQVISGIGFLGAGTIIVTRRHQIKGLTTAAGLWASAVVGLALGIGFYEAALLGVGAVLFVMTVMQLMDSRMHRKAKTLDVYLEVSNSISLGELLRSVRNLDIDISDIQKEPGMDADTHIRAYTASVKMPKRILVNSILETILTIDGIVYVEAL